VVVDVILPVPILPAYCFSSHDLPFHFQSIFLQFNTTFNLIASKHNRSTQIKMKYSIALIVAAAAATVSAQLPGLPDCAVRSRE